MTEITSTETLQDRHVFFNAAVIGFAGLSGADLLAHGTIHVTYAFTVLVPYILVSVILYQYVKKRGDKE